MAATSTSDATPAATVTSTDGPVLNLINKRIRALRKKQNRIIQMEESLSQGKALNKEQQEVLRSKPGVVALIEELEKLRSPLSAAVEEEVSLALAERTTSLSEQEGGVSAGQDEQQQQAAETVNSEHHPVVAGDGGGKGERDVEDLLNLLYFGSLFDVMPQSEFRDTMLMRKYERGCCLTYDTVTDEATDLLGDKDLDLIAAMKGLLISRPVDSSLSHKNALQRCIQHAKLWLANSDLPVGQSSDVTYVALREKLNKIRSSDYYTTSPEMKVSFDTFQVPLLVEEQPVAQTQETEGNTTNFEEYETAAPGDEHQKDAPEKEAAQEEALIQTEQFTQEQFEEQNPRDFDLKDQQEYNSRRSYQNQRGGGGRGGRRGYSNGRGGGGRGGGRGYHNNRSQYYDQGSNYYPRNNYRGRGGRGGSYYNNNHQYHSSQVLGGGHDHDQ